MSAEDALEEPVHVLVVGAGPVEAIAGGADTKIVITLKPFVVAAGHGSTLSELAGAASCIGGTGEIARPSSKENLSCIGDISRAHNRAEQGDAYPVDVPAALS